MKRQGSRLERQLSRVQIFGGVEVSVKAKLKSSKRASPGRHAIAAGSTLRPASIDMKIGCLGVLALAQMRKPSGAAKLDYAARI